MKDGNSPTHIDPRNPGASTNNDDHKDPWARSQGPSSNNNRSSEGTFADGNKSLPVGGESPDGDEMVRKYKPKGGRVPEAESGSELNDDGSDWA